MSNITFDKLLALYKNLPPNDGRRTALCLGLASDKRTPTKTLDELSTLGSFPVDKILASNPNTPKELLLHYANSTNTQILADLLYNPSFPPVLVDKVAAKIYDAEDHLPYSSPVFKVLRNERISGEFLKKVGLALLKETETVGEIIQVAKHVNTPPEVLSLCANTFENKGDIFDRHIVLRNLAGNPSTPQETLEKLYEKWSHKGRKEQSGLNVLATNRSLNVEHLTDFFSKINMNFHNEEMTMLPKDENYQQWEVHVSFLVHNVSTPAAILESLAGVLGFRYTHAICKHPNMTLKGVRGCIPIG